MTGHDGKRYIEPFRPALALKEVKYVGEPVALVVAQTLAQARDALAGSPWAWGAQDVSPHASGAYTGEVAAGMLVEFGCRYALVGHSERRQYHGEADAVVGAKAKATLAAGMTPVACVGETLAERDAGQWQAVVGRQFDAVAAAASNGTKPTAASARARAAS